MIKVHLNFLTEKSERIKRLTHEIKYYINSSPGLERIYRTQAPKIFWIQKFFRTLNLNNGVFLLRAIFSSAFNDQSVAKTHTKVYKGEVYYQKQIEEGRYQLDNQDNIAALREVLDSSSAKVVIVFTPFVKPAFFSKNENDKFYSVIDRSNFELINLRSNKWDNSYFEDKSHLNYNGARLIPDILAGAKTFSNE